MLFNSFEYFFFFIIFFIAYWFILKASRKGQNLLIVFGSYLFYGWWDWRFLSLIIASSFLDYFIGLYIDKLNNEKSRKALLLSSLFFNLGILGVFKYFNFFSDSFVQLLTSIGFQANPISLNIILPVGISFYTFQTLSYTIDVYRRKLKPTTDIISFFAFVSFFPQLVAGPIERASNLLPQFYNERKFIYSDAIDGLRQILWGFFKKVVIADNCATIVNSIFSSSSELSSLILVLGAILFAFQIYGDFSGYSDIAIGTAKLLGFNLMQNFAFPYFSRDIAEFWRRWHISLSTWFRDYLYIPLGGSRVSQSKAIRNVFAIFVVSGFWHGANWTFVIWGLLNAIYFLPSFILGSNRKHLKTVAENNHFPSLVELRQMIITFTLTCFAWIFFRAESFSHACNYIFGVVNYRNFFKVIEFDKIGLKQNTDWLILFFIGILLFVEWINRRNKHGLEKLPKSIILRWSIYISIALLIIQYFGSKETFIYFQF